MELSCAKRESALKSTFPFVGREREIARIEKALSRGDAVIVSGKFGIGRSRLVRHVGALRLRTCQFAFMDCSLTSGEICRIVYQDLFPERRTEARRSSYKVLRLKIGVYCSKTPPPIVVLDNVGKITLHKLDLFRFWKHCGFQFIAITETFLPQQQLSNLMGSIGPATIIRLGPLPPARVREYFTACCGMLNVELHPAEILGAAQASGGYPLAMAEMMTSLARRKRDALKDIVK